MSRENTRGLGFEWYLWFKIGKMLRTLNAEDAAQLDAHLMSDGGFSIHQLMELAGLSVAEAVYELHAPANGPNVIVLCGPGNNGGDGLVATRHLQHFGYAPQVYYPKRGRGDLFTQLLKQITDLEVPLIELEPDTLNNADFIVDAIFGFSFTGSVRAPFDHAIQMLQQTSTPVLAVDIPSSWSVNDGPPVEGLGNTYHPAALISLSAPKAGMRFFHGRHFLGGRFISKRLLRAFNIEIPRYEGTKQIVKLPKDWIADNSPINHQ